MEKYVIYNHPSTPPSDIKLGVWYKFEDMKIRFGLDKVVFLFQPCNFGYEEIEEIFPKKKDKK